MTAKTSVRRKVLSFEHLILLFRFSVAEIGIKGSLL